MMSWVKLPPTNCLSRTIYWVDLKLSHGRPRQWMSRDFLSVNNKQLLQDHLLSKYYHINLKLYLLRVLNNEHMNMHRLPQCHWLEDLSHKRLEQWTCKVVSSPLSLTNSLFKTIFQVKLLHWHETHRSPEKWMCRGFPSVTNKWPFQDCHLSKTLCLKALSKGDLNSKHAEDFQGSLRNSIFKTIFQIEFH